MDVVGSLLMITVLVILTKWIIIPLAPVTKFLSADISRASLVLYAVQTGIILLALYTFTIQKYRTTLTELGFVPIKIKKAALLIIEGYVVWMIVSYIVGYIMVQTGYTLPGYEPQAPTIPLFGTGKSAIIGAFFAAVIIAPTIEEAFFRGFILQTNIQKYGTALGSMLSALIFAILHFQFSNIIPLFILGLIINRIFVKGNSLWPCIGFHTLNNGIVLFIEFFFNAQ